MSNASYYNIKNVPSQLQSVDVVNLNVADTVTASVLNSDVSTGLVPFTFVPVGKQLHKVTLYTPVTGDWRNSSSSNMVTEKGGTIEFEFPEAANIVAAHLERQDNDIVGSVSFNLDVGAQSIMATVSKGTVNGVGANVSVYGDNNVIGGNGSVGVVPVTKGEKVQIAGSGTTTSGDLFAGIYYYYQPQP